MQRAQRVLISMILFGILVLIGIQQRTINELSKPSGELVFMEVQAKFNEVVSDKFKVYAQHHQDQNDLINKHEYYGALHHCMVTQILVWANKIPYQHMTCSPQFLHHEGFTSPLTPGVEGWDWMTPPPFEVQPPAPRHRRG